MKTIFVNEFVQKNEKESVLNSESDLIAGDTRLSDSLYTKPTCEREH